MKINKFNRIMLYSFIFRPFFDSFKIFLLTNSHEIWSDDNDTAMKGLSYMSPIQKARLHYGRSKQVNKQTKNMS